MSTPIDIEHLRHLARLALTPAQEQAARDDLVNIIHMIDEMQSVDTDGVEPLAHPIEEPARLRHDQVTEQVNRDQFQQPAPATEAGYYLVPKVIDSP